MSKASILSKIKPDPKILKASKELIKKLPSSEYVKFELGGSIAKNTHLKGSADIDIFARFVQDGDLSERLKILLKKFKPQAVHGSRVYYQFKYKKFLVEVVPVLLIDSPKNAKNVTDMSPLHVHWANSKLNNKLRNDIRLTKQFCKAQRIYGAESHIQGFSGHVIDILTIYYGGIDNLFEQVSKWKEKTVIDIEKHGTINKLSKSKTVGPLIVIDPVQPDRNAAAGVSKEAYNKFIDSTKKYLKTKRDFMFEIKPFNEGKFKIKNSGMTAIKLEYKPLKGRDDVVGSKIKQAINFIVKELKDFEVKDLEWDLNIAHIAVKNSKISEELIVKGPPTTKKKNSEEFQKKHKNTFVQDGRLCVKKLRKHTTPLSKVSHLIKQDYVKKRVNKIKCKKF